MPLRKEARQTTEQQAKKHKTSEGSASGKQEPSPGQGGSAQKTTSTSSATTIHESPIVSPRNKDKLKDLASNIAASLAVEFGGNTEAVQREIDSQTFWQHQRMAEELQRQEWSGDLSPAVPASFQMEPGTDRINVSRDQTILAWNQGPSSPPAEARSARTVRIPYLPQVGKAGSCWCEPCRKAWIFPGPTQDETCPNCGGAIKINDDPAPDELDMGDDASRPAPAAAPKAASDVAASPREG